MKTRLYFFFIALALLSALDLQLTIARAQGTTFTYQGRLNNGGIPASGMYDFRFKLYVDPFGNTQVGTSYLTNAVPTTNGLFITTIDFGAGIFTGTTNWLEVDVRTNGGGGYTVLNPFQELTPTPYAVFAQTAGNLSGVLPAVQLGGTILNASLPPSPIFSGTVVAGSFSGNGAGVTNVNAATLGGLTASNFWQTGGNSNTTAGVNFAGTTDSNAFEIHVDGIRVLRLEPDPRGAGAGNLIGGDPSNAILQPGSGGDVIGGGGFAGGGNVINTNTSGAFIGAGSLNQVGPNANDAVITGGKSNTNLSSDSVIGGGYGNSIQTIATWSTIGGGEFNQIYGDFGFYGGSVIGGGYANVIQTNASGSTISGGYGNQIAGDLNDAGSSVIGGGFSNMIQTNSYSSIIGGGAYDQIQTNSQDSTIGGGYSNFILTNASYGTIGGGANNRVGGAGGTAPGGNGNHAGGINSFAAGTDSYATNDGSFVLADLQYTPFYSTANNQLSARFTGGIVFETGGAGLSLDGQPVLTGGLNNLNLAGLSFVGGGYGNQVQTNAFQATIGGGYYNQIQTNAFQAAIGGGYYNDIQPLNYHSTIAGGAFNMIQTNAHDSAIGGGYQNVIGVSANNGVIGGGYTNTIQSGAIFSTIGGGQNNVIQSGAQYATIPGGVGNGAGGTGSFAAGSLAQATNDGSFVWADAQGMPFGSTAANQFLIRAAGGVGINTNHPAAMLHVAGEAIIGPDSSAPRFAMKAVVLGTSGTIFTHPGDSNLVMIWDSVNRILTVTNSAGYYYDVQMQVTGENTPSANQANARDIQTPSGPGYIRLTNTITQNAGWNVTAIKEGGTGPGFQFNGAGYNNYISGLITYWY